MRATSHLPSRHARPPARSLLSPRSRRIDDELQADTAERSRFSRDPRGRRRVNLTRCPPAGPGRPRPVCHNLDGQPELLPDEEEPDEQPELPPLANPEERTELPPDWQDPDE